MIRPMLKILPMGLLFIFWAFLMAGPIQAKIIPQVPDTQQPITGSIGNPINNACAPVSAVNIAQFWDVVKNHPNAFHVNATLIPKTAADYLYYFMDTNNWGSPVRMNGTVYPASNGTYSADIMPGFFEFVRWDALNPFTTPPPALPPNKLGYTWNYNSDYAIGFEYHAAVIDTGRPDIICFRYWNPINANVFVVDQSTGDTIRFYTWGPQISGSSPPNPTEQWNLNYGQECIGHAVTGVGYIRNYDPDGGGPLPMTNWFICHDNWSTTAVNVALPWANWAATITADPGPIISVAPDSIFHSQIRNTSTTYNNDFTISNTGPDQLIYSTTNTLPWITFTGMSGNIPSGGSDAINITVNTAGIATGIYVDSLTITSNDLLHPILNRPKIVIQVTLPPIIPCDYYKSPYTDYAPNGMPDFDQKQGNWWNHQTGNFSWCGPVALANCLWWFDSKFETSPIDPRPFYPGPGNPPPNDHYQLVPSLGPWDDHDINNVIPFINLLGPMCNVDGPNPGTSLPDLQAGFHSWLIQAGLPNAYTSFVVMGPGYPEIRDSVMASQDVILLLGFYEILQNQQCQRLGGHYVTCAGACNQDQYICISDPFFDKNEGEPPPGSAHGPAVHNDAFFVSGPHGTINHDRFQMSVMPLPSPCGPGTWGLTDYPNQWTQDGLFTFANENPILPGQQQAVYQGGQVVVMVDAALIICPAPPPTPNINVLPESLYYQQRSYTTLTYPKQIVIYNSGTGPLTISSISTDYSWITSGSFISPLASGQWDSVDVVINTNSITPGTYSGHFHIQSNDPDTAIMNKPKIVVDVTEPNIIVSPDSIFHSQQINTINLYSADFTIANTGSANLNYNVISSLAWVTFGGNTGLILPGGSDLINVTVNTNGIAAGTYLDAITINSDDPDTPILHKPKIAIEVTVPPLDTCNFYKSPYVDYAPNGMPDFDQKQDNWRNPQSGNFSWCGPVTLANCLWWFDSKFETNPLDPRPFYPGPGNPPANDHYQLVPSFGNWDDHDINNVVPFINALRSGCNVDGLNPGTSLPDLEAGFHNWLNQIGLPNAYNTFTVLGPAYPQIRDSVFSSQDVILLLGFYEILPGQTCQRLGGHYVTCAGACSQEPAICISDPYFDKNEGEPPPGSAHGSTVHNDAFFVSGPHGSINHDRYQMTPIEGQMSCGPATWYLPNYPNRWTQDGINNFANENPVVPGQPPVAYQGGAIVAGVDAALIICPVQAQPEPDINVVPDSIYHSQYTNTTVTYSNDFNIYNNGTATLLYGASNTLSWITLNPTPGSIPPGGHDQINITVNTSGIAVGTYLDSVTITSNDPDTPVLHRPKIVINVTSQQGCNYVVGDANNSGTFNGLDVTYSVSYFKGGPPPPLSCACPPYGTWYVAGDVNASCSFNGLDVTYMVSFFKGGPAPHPCPSCSPTTEILGKDPLGKEVEPVR